MEFKLTKDQRDQIIKELAEAPAKHVFNTIQLLGRLPEVEKEEVK